MFSHIKPPLFSPAEPIRVSGFWLLVSGCDLSATN
jgi:hypothetical protein